MPPQRANDLDTDYLVTSFLVETPNLLKLVLIDRWAQLDQDTLNRSIDHLPKRLMVIKQRGALVTFLLDCVLITDFVIFCSSEKIG